MLKIKGKTVLITGASSGIGLALAKLFALDGAHLILTALHEDKLEKVRADFAGRFPIRVEAIPSDLSKASSVPELVAEIDRRGLNVDMLVNNAGYGVYGKFFEEDLDPQLGMICLHVASLTKLTHIFLKRMVEKDEGRILNVASTAGFQPVPLEAIYGATKAYIVSFSEALAEELRGTNVRVSCLCPGPTQTPFFDNPLLKSWSAAKMPRMGCERVAEIAYEGFRQGKILIVPGFMNNLLIFGNRFAPRAMLVRIVRMIIEKPTAPKS